MVFKYNELNSQECNIKHNLTSYGILEKEREMLIMEYLAPIAFVFAIAALAQITNLRKEIEKLKEEIQQLKGLG